jgi:hypothetical protein
MQLKDASCDTRHQESHKVTDVASWQSAAGAAVASSVWYWQHWDELHFVVVMMPWPLSNWLTYSLPAHSSVKEELSEAIFMPQQYPEL